MLAATHRPHCAAERPTRFWNLTRHTISEFYWRRPAPPTGAPNQCKNDKDGTVDADERLRITDMPPGTYDAKLVDVSKRDLHRPQHQARGRRDLLDRGERADVLHAQKRLGSLPLTGVPAP